MKSNPEYNKEFVESHIKHLFEMGWSSLNNDEDQHQKLIGGAMAQSMKLLAENMELDINFEGIELDIELKKLQRQF